MRILPSTQRTQLPLIRPPCLSSFRIANITPEYTFPMALAMSPSEIQSQLAHIHENQSRHIITSGTICLSVAIVAVVLRLISRRLSRARSMLMDDYLVVGALVSLIFLDGQVHYALTHGRC